jgi:hypothetical protein
MVLQHFEDSVTSGEAEKYRCIGSLWRLKPRFSDVLMLGIMLM